MAREDGLLAEHGAVLDDASVAEDDAAVDDDVGAQLDVALEDHVGAEREPRREVGATQRSGGHRAARRGASSERYSGTTVVPRAAERCRALGATGSDAWSTLFTWISMVPRSRRYF